MNQQCQEQHSFGFEWEGPRTSSWGVLSSSLPLLEQERQVSTVDWTSVGTMPSLKQSLFKLPLKHVDALQPARKQMAQPSFRTILRSGMVGMGMNCRFQHCCLISKTKRSGEVCDTRATTLAQPWPQTYSPEAATAVPATTGHLGFPAPVGYWVTNTHHLKNTCYT